MVLLVNPTPTRFLTNILSTPVDSKPLHSIPCVWCPRGLFCYRYGGENGGGSASVVRVTLRGPSASALVSCWSWEIRSSSAVACYSSFLSVVDKLWVFLPLFVSRCRRAIICKSWMAYTMPQITTNLLVCSDPCHLPWHCQSWRCVRSPRSVPTLAR